MERDLVQIVGRAELPGRPIQYGTSEAFLEFVGVRTVEELPSSDVLSPRQIDEWLHEVSNKRHVTETEMGLPEGERADGNAEEVSGESDIEGESEEIGEVEKLEQPLEDDADREAI